MTDILTFETQKEEIILNSDFIFKAASTLQKLKQLDFILTFKHFSVYFNG